MEIKTQMKNASIQKREAMYQKMLGKQTEITKITNEMEKLKPSLPTDFLQKQTRLSQLPEIITKQQRRNCGSGRSAATTGSIAVGTTAVAPRL